MRIGWKVMGIFEESKFYFETDDRFEILNRQSLWSCLGKIGTCRRGQVSLARGKRQQTKYNPRSGQRESHFPAASDVLGVGDSQYEVPDDRPKH